MSTQKSSVRPYLPWKDGLPKSAQFGILKKLNGTWVNWKGGPTGLHTTPMPSPGTSSETIFGVFHFKSQEYTEQLKFTQVNAPVRNRAGSNEQFNGAVKYETAIIDNDQALQHFENGMYLWLGDNEQPWKDSSPYQNPPTMFKHPSDAESVKVDDAAPVLGPGELGPQFVPPHTISRSGVIPHGTTIHLTGNVTASNVPGAPPIAKLWDPDSLAISPTMGINVPQDLIPGSREKPAWTQLPREKQAGGGLNSGRAYFQRIFNYDQFGAKFPYTVQPNLKLVDANSRPGVTVKKHDIFHLDSQHPTGVQGATVNNVMIERYCRVVRMRFTMWLEEVEENGKMYDQLQYQQIVDFEFMFGSDGGTTQWPHIQVNTLRRLQDIAEADRLPPIQIPTESSADPSGGPEPVVYQMVHSEKRKGEDAEQSASKKTKCSGSK
eukprot:m.338699 g.338699  ORF g.338699 m.338699 type:complete len:435 (+) comp18507_c0_seq1:124-1428(+)